jgi:hypothetical protein
MPNRVRNAQKFPYMVRDLVKRFLLHALFGRLFKFRLYLGFLRYWVDVHHGVFHGAIVYIHKGLKGCR